MNAGRHKIITCALRGGFNKGRGFNFNKPVFVKIIARYLGYFVAQHNVALKRRAAQVKVAVFKPQILFNAGLGQNFKGRSFARAQNFKLGYFNFNIPRGNFGINRGAHTHLALCHNHKLAAQRGRLFKNRLVRCIVKRQLHYSAAVAKVNKYKPAEVALPLHPACNHYLCAYFLLCERAAIVGAFHTVHSVKFQP